MALLGIKLDKEKRSHLVEILSHVLNELCQQLLSSGMSQNTCNCFDSVDPPPINLKRYLKRIATFTGCSEESLVFSLIYIDRLITNPVQRFIVTNLNVHRLILSSVLVAVKFYDDHYYDNVFFSKVGGVSSKELNMLETEFLFLINFDLSVDPETYARYNKRLISCPTRLACRWNPSLPALIPKTFAGKLVSSLPFKRRKSGLTISIPADGVVAFSPECPASPSNCDSMGGDDMDGTIKNEQQNDNRSSVTQIVEKCHTGLNADLTLSAQGECPNVPFVI